MRNEGNQSQCYFYYIFVTTVFLQGFAYRLLQVYLGYKRKALFYLYGKYYKIMGFSIGPMRVALEFMDGLEWEG